MLLKYIVSQGKKPEEEKAVEKKVKQSTNLNDSVVSESSEGLLTGNSLN